MMRIEIHSLNKIQSIIVGIILLIAAIGGWFISYINTFVTAREESMLSMQAEVIAATLDRGALQVLRAVNEDINSPEYADIKHSLERARKLNEKSRFVYVIQQKGTSYYFKADAEPTSSEDFSPPGQEYVEAPQEIDWAYRLGQTFISGPNTDRWGTWLSAFAPILDDDGRVIGVVGVDTDAGENSLLVLLATLLAIGAVSVPLSAALFLLKIYINEYALSELRNEFMALAAHELRAPMTAISWTASSMLSSNKLEAKDAEKIRTIALVTKTLIGNITSILSLVKLEKVGASSRQFEKVNLSEVVTGVVTDVQLSIANQKGIICSIMIERDVYVHGGQTLLMFTFVSLLTNAIKYSPDNSQVDVSLKKQGQKIVVCVADRGIGIPDAERKKIFAGFYRASNAQKSGATGSGFGLYIIHRIIVLHKGSITSENREGGGSIFCVTLPLLTQESHREPQV